VVWPQAGRNRYANKEDEDEGEERGKINMKERGRITEGMRKGC
jgi:hypothetical protein